MELSLCLVRVSILHNVRAFSLFMMAVSTSDALCSNLPDLSHVLLSQILKVRSPLTPKLGAIALFTSLVLIVGMGEGAIAEPIPDWGPGDLETQVIPQDAGFLSEDGTRRGRNLLHRFESFDIDLDDCEKRSPLSPSNTASTPNF